MDEAFITVACRWCLGTGSILEGNKDAEGNPIIIPCSHCDETHRNNSTHALDITAIMADLSVTKKRLKKIMDKLEIGGD